MTMTTTIEPVTLSLELNCSAAHAFEVYTRDIASWWPTESHSVALENVRDVVFEAKVDGRIFETANDGAEHLWGTVLECEPPTHLRYQWHPGRDPQEVYTEVEVTIVDLGETSRFELVHTGFEKYGESAAAIRNDYVSGWQLVAGTRFKTAAEA